MVDSEYCFEQIGGSEGFACLMEGLANAVRSGEDVRVVLVHDRGDETDGEISCHLGEDGTLMDAVALCGYGQISLAELMKEGEDECDE